MATIVVKIGRLCGAEVGWRPVSGQPVYCGKPADGGTVSPLGADDDGVVILGRPIPTCQQCVDEWMTGRRTEPVTGTLGVQDWATKNAENWR